MLESSWLTGGTTMGSFEDANENAGPKKAGNLVTGWVTIDFLGCLSKRLCRCAWVDNRLDEPHNQSHTMSKGNISHPVDEWQLSIS